ncbi:MAG: DUF2721 domain-containing protein [Woeseiaceae bacterium]|nr:DUF2721 domain-containing protein [Woeseiaceae bacterium]
MDHPAPILAISEAIRLAVAPVFLLTGIGAILSVLTTRLGRVVDRARLVERRLPQVTSEQYQQLLREETRVLWRRIYFINWAIRLSVSSALLICVVVMSLFLGDVQLFSIGMLIAVLFVLAMGFLVLALLFLLFEVTLSTRKMQQSVEHLLPDLAHPAGVEKRDSRG